MVGYHISLSLSLLQRPGLRLILWCTSYSSIKAFLSPAVQLLMSYKERIYMSYKERPFFEDRQFSLWSMERASLMRCKEDHIKNIYTSTSGFYLLICSCGTRRLFAPGIVPIYQLEAQLHRTIETLSSDIQKKRMNNVCHIKHPR